MLPFTFFTSKVC